MGSEPNENIWNSLLSSAASSRQTPSKNVIVLGDPQSGKSTTIAAIKAANPTDPQLSSKASVGGDLALSYSYVDLREDEDVVARVGLHRVAGNPSYGSLLAFALSAAAMPGSLVILTLDWRKPWTFIESCDQWLSILRNRVAEISRRDPDLVDECRRALESSVRSYTDPSDSIPSGELRPESPLPIRPPPSPVKQSPVSLSGIPTGAPQTAAIVTPSSSGQPTLPPLPEGCLTDNLGVPIVIVCTKADSIGMLERDSDYREEQFDFIQQALRTICLKYGASLFYTSTTKPHTTAILRSYVLHRLFHHHPALSVAAPSSPSSSRRLTSFPFLRRAQVVERDAVFVPAGWDSWGKIRVLRDGFDCALAAETSGDNGQNRGEGAKEYFATVIKRPAEKVVVPNPTVTAEDDQAFLERQLTVLNDGSAIGRAMDSPLARTSTNAHGGDLSQKLHSLRPGLPSQSSSPTAAAQPGAQTEMIEKFFQNLLTKRGGGRSASISNRRPEDGKEG
ncbi:dynein light intermediate chain [Gonapodya prolifera JEL478]|uniref:Dynein light intermediate chain n=1 Tax=Gonapodya prolifera (strain JEL478) TaxID=1344416 RepID=A0A139A5N8_GONPJ|nr:dynein light intermediate chain [Gonapodya prolifera JEL478]|eukprot:KXS12064.1 dynein light intermediate chain [Gonapodya prolifera JEL478]